jgi:hypothetical protein
MALLRDPDPEVQSRALDVLWWLRQDTVPRADLLRVLGSERVDTVNRALAMLYHRWPPDWSVTSLYLATRFLAPSVTNDLSSAEAAPLMTNRLTMARLMGLKILRRNADAQAVALTLPLLRDTNSFVRDRALDLLRTVSGQNIPKNEPAKWEQWWAANKNLFAESEPGMGGAFVDIMRSLARDTYLTSLVSEPATYRQGENVKLMADVFNGGRRDRNLRLTVSIYAGEPRPLDAEPTGKPCSGGQGPADYSGVETGRLPRRLLLPPWAFVGGRPGDR